MSKLERSKKALVDTKAKMRHFHLTCQNCGAQYNTIKDFKVHVRSYSHNQAVSQLFLTAGHKGPVFLPIIVVLDYLRDPSQRKPIIGLDMVTLCITPEKIGAFYLCHVCGENLNSQDVLKHLCSVDHYFKYLAYSNPELLQFSWNSLYDLQSSAKKEHNTRGSGNLRILELPRGMLKRGQTMAYHQVMTMFSKTDKVKECVWANRPQRKTLNAYITDPARTKPLLGLNFLLEFSCPDSEWHCGYLCILCRKKVSAINCISHCISFDHIYWYMNAAYPGILQGPKSSYTNNSYDFNQRILDLANQAQKEHPPGPVESVDLDLSTFKEVISSTFSYALNKLEQMRGEKNQSECIASVEPEAQICSTAQTRGNSPVILCVECDETFSVMSDYKRHITGSKHTQKLTELFDPDSYDGTITEIKLYNYLWSRYKKKASSPLLIGLQLLTVLVNRWSRYPSQAIYLCHACEINISTCASIHLTSEQHYFNVFAHSKPDLVFLGSRNLNQITEFFQEEQLRQRKEIILRVCEIPNQMSRTFKNLSYERIMAAIDTLYSQMSKCIEVQKRVTLLLYAQSSDRKSPLVGMQCLVKYCTAKPSPKCGYLCLLCERKLPEMLVITHMLSSSHIFAYLNAAHPGSLRTDEHEQKSLIIDLAQQAEAKSSETSMQEVELDFEKLNELDTIPFKAVLNALQLDLKQKGLEELKLSVVPGARLVSSLEKHCQKDSLQSVKQESNPTSLNVRQINTEASHKHTSRPVSDSKASCLKTEPTEEPTETVSPVKSSHHNPANARESCSMLKPLRTKNQSFSQPQCTLAQNPKEPLEAFQRSTGSKNKAKIEPQSPPSGNALWKYLNTSDREPVIGLNSVIECHTDGQPPLYLCTSCTERVKENSIIKHLTSSDHQKKYVISTSVLTTKKTKGLRLHAMMMEKAQGYGEAQILELNAEDYHHVLHDPIVTALTKVRDLLRKMTDISDQNTVASSSTDEKIETMKNTMETTEKDKQVGETMIIFGSNSKSSKNHSDEDDPVQSSPHLWSYLNSPNRTEPVIGLDMVTEYRSFSGQNSFLCSCCKVMLATDSYVGHLISPRHRFSYMKVKHPNLVKMWTGQFSFTDKISELRLKANILQDSEGWGHIKVVEKDSPKQKKQTATSVEYSVKEQKPEPSKTSSDTGAKISAKEHEPEHFQISSETGAKISAKEHELEHFQISSETVCTEHQDQNQQWLKSAKRIKMKKRTALIGLHFVTCVSHGKKELYFCELCSVRCHFGYLFRYHMSSVAHRKAYVQHKYPGWTADDAVLEKKLQEIAVHLAAAERSTGIGMKKLYVPAEVFTSLKITPVGEALAQLKLQQTKQEAQLDLRCSLALSEPSHYTESDYTKETIYNDHMLCTAEVISSVLPEQTSVPETSVIADKKSSALSESQSCSVQLLDSCSVSSVPVSSLPLLSFSTFLRSTCDPSSQFTSYTDIHTPVKPCTTHSLKTSPSIPNLPPDSQTVTTSQSLSLPLNVYEPLSPAPANEPLSPAPANEPLSSEPANEPLSPEPANKPLLPAPVVEPVSSSPLNELISLYSSSSSSQPSLYVASLYSPSPTSSDNSSVKVLQAQPSRNHFTEGEVQADVTTYSEETRTTHTYSFLKVPSVIGQSNAYAFLSLRNLFGTEPIIGLGHIVECRTMSRPTFFLCLNCAEKISREDFCCHMTSEQHWRSSIRVQYPEEYQEWQTNYKLALRDLAGRLALREQGSDAKVIKLDQKHYECLQFADFFIAFEMLLNMYGPDQSQNALPSHLKHHNQRETSTAQMPVCVDTERDTPRHPSLLNYKMNPIQTKQVHSESPINTLDRLEDNPDGSTETSILIKDQSQLSQSLQKTWRDIKIVPVLAVPEAQPKTDLKAKSPKDSANNSETTQEMPDTVLSTLWLQQKTNSLPCTMRIKQEKLDYGNSFKPRSDLINSLNSKRDSKSMADAVVGLSSIIECQSDDQPSLYLCMACSSKLNHDLVINHLMKPGHRESYLRHRYPFLFEDWPDSDTRTRSVKLMRLAHHVEKTYEDEPGQLQEMTLQCADLQEIKGLSFDKAIMQLQKIRNVQNLCALQTSIPPKKQPVLVKQENMEIDVKPQYFPPLANSPEKTAQSSRVVSKRRGFEADSSQESPPVAKQTKQENVANSPEKNSLLSRAVSKRKSVEADSTHKLPKAAKQTKLFLESSWNYSKDKIELPKLQKCDDQMPRPPRPHSAKAKVQKCPISKQNPGHAYAGVKPVSCSISPAGARRHKEKQHSCPTQKPTTSTQPSKKSKEQTKSEKKKLESSSKTHEANIHTSKPQLNGQTSLDICSSKTSLKKQSESQDSKTGVKQTYAEREAVSSVQKKQRFFFNDYPTSPMQQVLSVLHSPVPSESLIRKKSLDERLADLPYLQNMLRVLSDGSHTLQPKVRRDPDLYSPTERDPSYQPLNKTVSAILPPQQSHPCPPTSATSVPAMQAQGQKIARLHEGASLKIRSSENAWNYKNQQLSTDTIDTSLVSASSDKTDYEKASNDAVSKAYACTGGSSRSFPISAQNANLYLPMTPSCATTTSATNAVLPGYAVPYQYLGYTQPVYAAPGAGTSAYDYTVAENGGAMNAEAAAQSHSPSLGYYVPNANSAYTSEQVYLPVQSFQPPDAYQAFYSAYNLQESQTTNLHGSVTLTD